MYLGDLDFLTIAVTTGKLSSLISNSSNCIWSLHSSGHCPPLSSSSCSSWILGFWISHSDTICSPSDIVRHFLSLSTSIWVWPLWLSFTHFLSTGIQVWHFSLGLGSTIGIFPLHVTPNINPGSLYSPFFKNSSDCALICCSTLSWSSSVSVVRSWSSGKCHSSLAMSSLWPDVKAGAISWKDLSGSISSRLAWVIHSYPLNQWLVSCSGVIPPLVV